MPRAAVSANEARTAREVVELYNLVVWNERNFELAEELMGDNVIRHGVGEVTGDDGEHVAVAYQSPMNLRDGTEATVGSMEIFRVVGGRITEVWNYGYGQGDWQ